jgi:hypothetical protein
MVVAMDKGCDCLSPESLVADPDARLEVLACDEIGVACSSTADKVEGSSGIFRVGEVVWTGTASGSPKVSPGTGGKLVKGGGVRVGNTCSKSP